MARCAAMKTRSTEEAMGALEERHSATIAIAREIAIELCHKNGSTHSRAVRAEMFKRGIITGKEGPEYWLGAVFKGALFEWTGSFVSYADRERNVHERTLKVWKLRGSPSENDGGDRKPIGRLRSGVVSSPERRALRPPGPKAPAPLPRAKPPRQQAELDFREIKF
jgi:hypothetical protein